MKTKVVQTACGFWVPVWAEGNTVHIWDYAYRDRAVAETAVVEAWFHGRRVTDGGGVEIHADLRRSAMFAAVAALREPE